MLKKKFISVIASLIIISVSAIAIFAKGEAQVRLDFAKASFSQSEKVMVNVTISNPERNPIRLLKWLTPIDGLEEALFSVTKDGKEVKYIGAHYKRPEPAAADYITLKGGRSITRSIDLAEYYDLSGSGDYQVSYEVKSFDLYRMGNSLLDREAEMKSGAIRLWIEGRPAKMPEPSYPDSVAGATSFARCTTSQAAQAGTARNDAAAYAANALSYLNAGNTGLRYTTWFGAYNAGRYGAVTNNFNAISNALENAPVTINCGCKKTYYAYVYSNQPYTIYVCKAFWTAPATGTDSKAGTLVHEMSHFDIVAGTNDWVYGQTGAKNLAISNPANAADNADNHEYFAENTPFQN